MTTPDVAVSPGADARSQPLHPTATGERITTLDILRGIALLGVAIANVWLWFSGTWFLFPDFLETLVLPSADALVFYGISLFISGKAITTFSFLFGLGFAVQMARAESRGMEILPVYRRRLAVLLLIGIAHAFLLWYGDVLATYALIGFLLILFRGRRDRTLAIWAAVLLIALPLVMGSIPLLISVFAGGMPPPDMAEVSESRRALLAAFASGNAPEVVAANVEMLKQWYVSPKTLIMLTTLGIFLVGFVAGRRRIFEQVDRYRDGFRRVAIGGLALGLTSSTALTVLMARLGPDAVMARPVLALVGTVLNGLGTLPLAAGYIAAVTLLLERDAWRRVLGVFAPVGQMALTNYLSQTVLFMTVFYGYGGGLVGEVGPAIALVIALAVFGVQIGWSRWWLAHFRFGPAEWAWRSATYGRLQPMRLEVPVVVQPQISA